MFGSEKSNTEEIGLLWQRLSTLEESSSDFVNRIKDVEDRLIKPSDSQKEALTAARSASQHNSKVKELKRSIIDAYDEISVYKEQVSNDLIEVTNIKDSVSEIVSSIEENKSSLQEIVNNAVNQKEELDNSLSQINALLSENEDLEYDINALRESLESASTNSTKIENLLKGAASIHSKITELKDEIFGYEVDNDNEDGLVKIAGLKDELDSAYNELNHAYSVLSSDQKRLREESCQQLSELLSESSGKVDNFIEECDQRFDSTHNEIRRLLPEALTAGLSAAYDKKIREEEQSLTGFQGTFNKAIMFLVLISLVPFGIDIYLLLVLKQELIAVISDTPKLLISILPLYFPVLWVAYSSNKKLNLSKRLIEEYTHKGVLSKTYEGLSNQIEDVGHDSISNDLKIKLLYNLLSVNSENPGKLISDYKTTDHPLIDALDKGAKYADAIDILRKIPGFSALANKLEQEGRAQIKKADDKISSVINNEKSEE